MHKVKPVAQKTQSYLTTELPSQLQKIFPIESSTPAPSSLEIKWLHFSTFFVGFIFTKVNYMPTIQDTSSKFSRGNLHCSFITSW